MATKQSASRNLIMNGRQQSEELDQKEQEQNNMNKALAEQSNKAFSRPMVNKLKGLADVESASNYIKLEDIEDGAPIVITGVTSFTEGDYNGRKNTTARFTGYDPETQEDYNFISSAYMVVNQLRLCQEQNLFPVEVVFVKVKLDGNKSRWEMHDTE